MAAEPEPTSGWPLCLGPIWPEALAVSNLRPRARVARDVLFYRPSKRCERGFLYCRAREPGRLYCDECTAPARRERERKARRTYRESVEGLEQHRDEEEERREWKTAPTKARCAADSRLESMASASCGACTDDVATSQRIGWDVATPLRGRPLAASTPLSRVLRRPGLAEKAEEALRNLGLRRAVA